MKNKVCIIICYFGNLPNTIDTFLYSCRKNSDFNWIIFTDCDVKNIPQNVKIQKKTLKQVKELAEKKVNIKINLETPYKLCDYKVAYGLIFEDYLEGYDFWGYGDLDVVYGNLKSFITDEILDKYDKIYPLGHLSLMRNTEKCRTLFMIEADGTSSYKNVFSSGVSCFFDEDRGINDKLEAKGLKIYSKFDFADIDGTYKRFRNVDKKTLSLTLPSFKYFNELKTNYKNQIFYYSDGHLYQRHIENRIYIDEEISYIHYRKKLEVQWNLNSAVMLITPIGIIGTDSVPTCEDIYKYNSITENETFTFLRIASHRIMTRKFESLKDRIILILGKSNLLRQLVRNIKYCLKNVEEE